VPIPFDTMFRITDPTDDDLAGAAGVDAGTARTGRDDRPGAWVSPSVAPRLTTKAVSRLTEKGLRDLAAHGGTATSLRRQVGKAACTSLGRQAGRAACKSAASSAAAGALADLHGLLRHNLNARQFVAMRGVDAAQAGITAAASTTSIAGVTAGATFLASTLTAGTLAATVAGTVAASTAVVPAAAAIAVGYGVSHAANPLRRYLTDRLHGRPDFETDETHDGTSRRPIRVTRKDSVESIAV
jgi:hypothetical protein